MYWVKYLKEYCKLAEPLAIYTAFLKWLADNDFELKTWSFFVEELCITSDNTQKVMWRKVLSNKEDFKDAYLMLKELVDEGVFAWYSFLEKYKITNYKQVFIDDFIKNEEEKENFITYLKTLKMY